MFQVSTINILNYFNKITTKQYILFEEKSLQPAWMWKSNLSKFQRQPLIKNELGFFSVRTYLRNIVLNFQV